LECAFGTVAEILVAAGHGFQGIDDERALRRYRNFFLGGLQIVFEKGSLGGNNSLQPVTDDDIKLASYFYEAGGGDAGSQKKEEKNNGGRQFDRDSHIIEIAHGSLPLLAAM